MAYDLGGATPADSIKQTKVNPIKFKPIKKLESQIDSFELANALKAAELRKPTGNSIEMPPKSDMIMRLERARELASPEIRADLYAVKKGEMTLDDFMQKWKIE